MKQKATFIPVFRKEHNYKKYGLVIVHDEAAEISFNEFDLRYQGPRSRLGKYLQELKQKGVSVADNPFAKKPKKNLKEPPPDELTIKMAKRLYEALVKRNIGTVPSKYGTLPVSTFTPQELFDWNDPMVKTTKYYRMAEQVLKETDPIKIINIITGYA